ncbi:MAG: bifunctional UDP-3-O-[3-hydroxymyristoyl] N-acetylglucosamine deacetylase/3-hydroxyacyl-ACP dehydratase [Bacteroidota bacterium]
MKQQTIKKSVSLSGVGLHTGVEVTLVFNPAPENFGIKFQRTDMPGQPIIDADVDNVTDLSRGTTLEQNGGKVATVEHVMASLAGLEIDNCLVQINAEETPIMDGSAQFFIMALKDAGIQKQEADREYFTIPQNIFYHEQDRQVEMIAMPLDDYRLTVMVDYNSPVLGSQHASITSLKEFEPEIASCRTFCFLHELEMLYNNNLIRGGDLNNAIVIVDRVIQDDELEHLAKMFNKPRVEVKREGILNNVELRFHNEPARHKLLDLIGDLALIGTPIKAQIMAARPGHAANVAFGKKIKALIKKTRSNVYVPRYDANKEPVLNAQQIAQILPHKYPFLLVDKVIEIGKNHIVAVKNVTYNEPFFPGHFPNNPVMPGVLIIEAMAQAGGVLILSQVDDPQNYNTYFMKIDNAKFKEKVVPGNTLIFKLDMIAPVRRGVCVMKASAFVGDKLVCEAELMAQVVKK